MCSRFLEGIALALACASCGSRAPAQEAQAPAPIAAGRNAGANPYLGNAYAMSEGKRLFSLYNCTGCHGHGGGGIGPALMDAQWRYGSAPDQLFATIVQGRPNGMPAFRGKLPDYQVWMLVSYVRAMAGLAPKDAAPSRDDSMNVRPPENLFAPQGERGEATEPLQ